MSDDRESQEPPLEPDFVDRFSTGERPAPEGRRRSRGRRPSLFGPLLLIGLGVLLLLDQLGYVEPDYWFLLARYWPLLLILMGLDLLFGRRSAIGGILGALIPLLLIAGVFWLVFGGRLPGWVAIPQDSSLTVEAVEYPLGDLTEARVHLDLGSWRTIISGMEGSDNLLEGTIATYGVVDFQSSQQDSRAELTLGTSNPSRGDLFSWPSRKEEEWRIGLSPAVALDLEVDCGSGAGEYNLRALNLRTLALDGGSGSFDLLLPAERGMEIALEVGSGSMDLYLPARGSADLVIDGGTGRIRIALPDRMAARVEIQSGSGAFVPSARFDLVEGERDGDGVWETADYGQAENRFEIKIEAGSGSISIEGE